jgi:putative colanic acid biosynthesis acetyltransferase WcaB
MNFLQDIKLNKNNSKGLFIILFFRLSSYFSKNIFLKTIGFPVRILYKLIVQWILGCDISDTTKIGKGFSIYHGQGIVVNSEVIIGVNCVLRQNTTIGISNKGGKSPHIGNNVDIGANSVIIGDILIGNYVIIGAGSVVTKDIPCNSVFVGNPARSIYKKH